MSQSKITLRKKLKLLMGTPRRLLWNVCRPGYVMQNLKQRRGECQRCGACCRLVWKCRYFHYENGTPSCKLYKKYRPPNCSNFPIDHHDLADRDVVAPHVPCGFWWDDEKGKKNKKKAGA